MTEQQQLQFHNQWRSDGNYGQVLNLDGIHASVSPGRRKAARGYEDVVYATIYGLETPKLHRDDFTSFHNRPFLEAPSFLRRGGKKAARRQKKTFP